MGVGRGKGYIRGEHLEIFQNVSFGRALLVISVHAKSLVSNSVTLWTVAHQAPHSMGFSSQEYRSG